MATALITALESRAAVLGRGVSATGILNMMAPRRGILRSEAIAYASGPRRRLDVYQPRDARGAPVVVFFYGGGWDSGERAMYRFFGASLAAAGIVCVIPDYRIWPAVRFPGFVEDAARAVAWARAQAGAFGGDPGNLFLMGHSAGAHIATMLALDPTYLDAVDADCERDLRGVIGLSGPYDFLPLRSQRLKEIFGPADDWPQSQPVNFVTRGAAPMLLATGEADDVVLPRNSLRLASRLRAAGNEVTTRLYPGVGHAPIVGAFASALRFIAPVRKDTLGFIAARSRR